MTTEPPLTLREVAKRLGRIHHLPTGKTAVPQLLGLLKAGELKAGFEFPGTKVYWIPIPTSYWTGISSQKFGSLRYVPGDKVRNGTYQVGISDFVDEYIQVISPEATGSINTVLDELKKALYAAQNRYEVAITNEEWTKYLERHGIPASALQQSSSVGRPEKEGWHHLVPIIAGYMMTIGSQELDHLSIAATVHELASKRGITKLPSVPTIRDVISKAFVLADELPKR